MEEESTSEMHEVQEKLKEQEQKIKELEKRKV